MCVPRPYLSCDGVTGSVWIRFVSMSVTELRGDVDGATISPMLAALFTLPASCSVHVTLIRHGQTEWNVAGRLQGASDSALTARGVQRLRVARATGEGGPRVRGTLVGLLGERAAGGRAA